MHLAETPEEQRAWMNQWRAAAVALRQMKREELHAMMDEDAVAAFQRVGYDARARLAQSGAHCALPPEDIGS